MYCAFWNTNLFAIVMTKFFTVALLFFALIFFAGCNTKKNIEQPVEPDHSVLSYEVITVLPHDELAFTQGLTIFNNKILESTGQNGSWIAEVDPGSGTQDKKVTLGNQYFGEGITVLNNKIYQLTWKNKVGFIYDASSYKKLGEFNYGTEGWGITTDKKNLIMSDGTEKLFFIDTASLKVSRTVNVMEKNLPVKKLNELEYIGGYVYANVWETPVIVKIDPANGNVVGKLDLSVITNEIESMYPRADVLNGIAFDARSKALLITGKLWPKAYLIRIK
jgi:glutamine cyclotransferase